MSSDQGDLQTLRCPACRARQPWQEECRRCSADLTLLVKVKRRVAYLIREREAAIDANDHDRAQQLTCELQELLPSSGGAYSSTS